MSAAASTSAPARADYHDLPFWTEADDAELDLVLTGFIDTVALHRDRCPDCIGRHHDNYPWCRPLREAWQALADWAQHRRLESEAIWLRDLQRAAERVRADPERYAYLYA